MAEYKVNRLTEKLYGGWNEFVEESPQGTIFHTTDWLSASKRDFDVFRCFKGQEPVGGVPVAYSKMAGMKVIHNPPLTPYGGPVFRKSDSKYVSKVSNRKRISKCLIEKLKENFNLVINWTLGPGVVDLQPFLWEGFSPKVKYTYLLSLEDLDDVWNSMDSSRRRDIRRAEKDGVTVERSDNFEEMFDLVEKTFDRQEEDVEFRRHALAYNEGLEESNRCKSFIAKNSEGESIASVYLVWDQDRAYYLMGGYDPKRGHHGGTAMTMWRAIEFTKKELGKEKFDFEGSMIPEIERFFRKFGGKLTPCYTLKWSKSSILLWLAEREWLRNMFKSRTY